ncbi:MAG: SGNH/GDSL hydrolase family protein [Candidatus Binatia bacterium]|nr:SGNH/GDSL hydrolase family protein [Candidatus Binatia bacterium]
MRRIVLLVVLALAPACSRTTVTSEPSILDSVACVRNEVADERAGLDVWNETMDRFERGDAENPTASTPVVFVGSSSIVFWQTVKDDMAPLPVLNRGFGGSATRQATHNVERIVLPYDPRAVVLYEGDNDLAFGMSADCVLLDMQAFVEKVHAGKPGVPIYILAVKPSIARAHLWEESVRANALIAALAEEDPEVTFIDVATPMFDEDGKLNKDLFVADGLHMNAKGYAIWTEAVRPVLLADLN